MEFRGDWKHLILVSTLQWHHKAIYHPKFNITYRCCFMDMGLCNSTLMKHELFKWTENSKRRELQDSTNGEQMWIDPPPPPTTDLSPFEPTRAQVIKFITFKNMEVGFPSSCFWKINSVGIYSVTTDWQGCHHHMGTTEKANCKK
jgi:hypothetical protein